MTSKRPSRDNAPKWRSLTSSKKPIAATSISRIFAQPEPGSPLRSAIDNLPAVGIDDSASFISEMSRKRERADSVLSAMSNIRKSKEGDGMKKRSRMDLQASTSSADTPIQDAPHVAPSQVIDLTVDDLSPNLCNLAVTAPSTASTFPLAVTDSPKNISEVSLPGDSPQTLTVPDASSDCVKPVTVPDASPRRSSWFGSLTRSKDNDRASNPIEELILPSAQRQSNIQTPQSASVADDNASAGALSVPVPRSRWTKSDPGPLNHDLNSDSPPSEPFAIPSQAIQLSSSPSPPDSHLPSVRVHHANNATSISSIDEVVPLPKLCTSPSTSPPPDTPALVQSHVEGLTSRKPSISSLNPTASRFMLRIPLLGRPKVPLNQAMAAAQEGAKDDSKPNEETQDMSTKATGRVDRTEPQFDPSDTISSAENDQNMTIAVDLPAESIPSFNANNTESETVSPDRTESSPDAHTQGPQNEDQSKMNEQLPAPSSTWWDYLGWGGTTSVVQAPASSTNAQTSPDDINDISQSPSPEGGPTVNSPTTSDAFITHQVHAEDPASVREDPSGMQSSSVEAQVNTTPVVSEDLTPSLFSAETAKNQSTAWYAPWSWYYSSAAPSSSNAAPPEPVVNGQSDSVDINTKTESEMVKEEALAREDPAPIADATAEASVLTAQVISTNQPSNPIETSISTNTSGWASFFMSRALLVKHITYESKEHDENGMEVMDIDEDEDQGHVEATPASPPRSIVSASGREAVQRTQQQQSGQPASPPKSPTAPKQREQKKSSPPGPPLTNSESIKQETTKATVTRSPSPAPSKKSGASSPTASKTQTPNLVLPTWEDTFHSAPRSFVLPKPQPTKSKLSKTLSFVSGVLFAKDTGSHGSVKGKEREWEQQPELLHFGKELPKALDILGEPIDPALLRGDCRVVVIGVAGWSPGAVTRTIAGGLPSSSSKFVNMTCSALEKFEDEHGFKFKKITKIPLEGDGTIVRKVTKVHSHLLGNEEWLEDLHAADVIFVATHSQGSIISTHLLEKLIGEGHILTPRNVDILASTATAIAPGGAAPASSSRIQRICCLALCGIHLGPLRYLKTSSLFQPYIQYFENAAARELFEFQDTETQLSKDYVKALRTVMDHGAKMVYVASLNDQVVPIYSGLFTAASHPRILRALYIDRDAYHSSDFLSNLLVLLIRIMNTGLSDSGLLAHLSEATAGTLSGVGHSSAYEELSTFSLAVKYQFLTNEGADVRTDLKLEPFNAVNEQNDYEIPWSLRDLIADDRVSHFFARDFAQLRDAFDDWLPRTSILRDIKRKLQPIQRLSSIKGRTYSRL